MGCKWNEQCHRSTCSMLSSQGQLHHAFVMLLAIPALTDFYLETTLPAGRNQVIITGCVQNWESEDPK